MGPSKAPAAQSDLGVSSVLLWEMRGQWDMEIESHFERLIPMTDKMDDVHDDDDSAGEESAPDKLDAAGKENPFDMNAFVVWSVGPQSTVLINLLLLDPI